MYQRLNQNQSTHLLAQELSTKVYQATKPLRICDYTASSLLYYNLWASSFPASANNDREKMFMGLLGERYVIHKIVSVHNNTTMIDGV
jgi:hypothetical protein